MLISGGTQPDLNSRSPVQATWPRRKTAWTVAIAVTAAALLLVTVWLVGLLVNYQPIGPSDFAPADEYRVSAGSIGCRPTVGEICYAASFDSALQGLTLAHLRFVVANASPGSTTNGPIAPPLPLGASAQVTALGSPTSVAGIWNMPARQWVIGGGWPVPSGPDVTVILDTGLVSNTTLLSAMFFIVLTSPYGGALGFPLFCGGC